MMFTLYLCIILHVVSFIIYIILSNYFLATTSLICAIIFIYCIKLARECVALEKEIEESRK